MHDFKSAKGIVFFSILCSPGDLSSSGQGLSTRFSREPNLQHLPVLALMSRIPRQVALDKPSYPLIAVLPGSDPFWAPTPALPDFLKFLTIDS